ncbi:2,3-cyclic-nucleotide 2-phosphodiesterase [Fructilactobacillus florum DSM 22689 = JCM 16035]|uniref:Ribonuclease Y n=1 Tax=Fructilactobacillus florum DSM 22689 = JCM 16035 TaxID=1423745 RepID=A0A0R2CF27_9LACO|nr:2,3-cyclic-nucleotide 2-phosphodiesterase [Fructilactobacillus florum DSM 22689 = JCM 16035]
MVVTLLFGFLVGYGQANQQLNRRLSQAASQAKKFSEKKRVELTQKTQHLLAENQADVLEYQADEEQEIAEQAAENQARLERVSLLEKSLLSFSQRLDKQQQVLDEHREALEQQRARLTMAKQTEQDLQRRRGEILGQKSALTANQAKQVVLQETETKLAQDFETTVRENHDFMVLNAPRDARNLMTSAIQSAPSDAPKTHIERNILISDPKMRAKITGKNEQRLRLLETLIGVDLIFNPELPESLIISTNDPLRREVARTVINELMTARQLNQGMIENTVKLAQRRLIEQLRQTGETTWKKLQLGWVHPDLLKLLGRMQYRTSYGQNVLQHSVEVAELCGLIAAELGIQPQLAKRAGLLHDIGKAVDREVNGTHVELGVKIAEAYREPTEVVQAIAASHGDVDGDDSISILVRVADSLSGSRPGARSESVEEYINRLKGLERIARQHQGVKDSYAIQAGREIRIIVNPNEVDDHQSQSITDEVAAQIEAELTYPGKIKITTIRQLSAVQYVGGKPTTKKKHAS